MAEGQRRDPPARRYRGSRRWLPALVLAGYGLVAAAASDDGAMLQALTAQDGRVAAVAFRLLRAAPPLCAQTVPLAGFSVHDPLQYAVALRPAAVRLFGFGATPAVLAVAPDSPAERAGLRAGDAILAVNDVAVPLATPAMPDDRRPSYARTEQLERSIAAALADGEVALRVVRGGAMQTIRVAAVQGCDSPVQVQPGRTRGAWSDGRSVALTASLVVEAASDDELAAVIGHEIAHNILRHRALLEAAGIGSGLSSRIGGKAARVRETERIADRVGLFLAARAGYDPAAAVTFWQRYGTTHGDGLLADATHPGWRARAAALTAVATEIAALRERGAPLLPDGA